MAGLFRRALSEQLGSKHGPPQTERLALTGSIASVFLLLQLFGLADLNRRAIVCGTADRRPPICVVHAWWLTTLASIPVPPSPTRDFIPSRQPRSVAGAM